MVFFHSLPVPELREWIFSIPFPFPNSGNWIIHSRSRIPKCHSRSPLLWKYEDTDLDKKRFNSYSLIVQSTNDENNEKHRLRRNKRSNLYSVSTKASFVFECWCALSCFVMFKRLFLLQERHFFQVVPFYLLAVSSIARFTSQFLTPASFVNPIISKILDIDILQIIFHSSFVQWTFYCNLFNLDQLGTVWKWDFPAGGAEE